MKISALHKLIVSKYPLSNQEKWDESGMAFLIKDEEIHALLLCLDLTNECVEEAINNHCNFVISHHPIFIKSKEYPPSEHQLGLIKKLKEHHISFASYHTNVDNSPNGLNWYIAKKLKLNSIKVIPNSSVVIGKLGREVRPVVFADSIRQKFNLERTIFSAEGDQVSTVAIAAGAGFSLFRQNLKHLQSVSLLVTGDVGWHDFLFARQHNLNIMDVGHDLENCFIDLINDLILDSHCEPFPIITKPTFSYIMFK